MHHIYDKTIEVLLWIVDGDVLTDTKDATDCNNKIEWKCNCPDASRPNCYQTMTPWSHLVSTASINTIESQLSIMSYKIDRSYPRVLKSLV